MKEVFITKLPISSFSYYQWLLLGLYELEQKNEIKLHFRVPLISRIVLLWFNNKYIAGVARQLVNRFDKNINYNLVGFVKDGTNQRSFTVDPKDSPYIYDVSKLESCDKYFKLQCPKEIKKEGFRLTDDVLMPYFDIKFGENKDPYSHFSRIVTDKVYKLRDKIKPGMIGPRRLAWGCGYRAMKKQYDIYAQSRNVNQDQLMTAYFRFATGPKPTENLQQVDPDLEWDLMAYFKSLSHPNIKRDKAVKMMNSIGAKDIDGRMIYELDETTNKTIYHADKEVPLSEFCDFIASFKYNLNISGFRMSIPNRFIESFIAGTAIVTDKLSLKWYLPFEDEVIETVEMGYLQDKNVDWQGFSKDLKNLPIVEKSRILDLYEKKWSPSAFAKYIIEETLSI